MAIELIVLMFLRAQVAASGAIVLIMLLRWPARRLIGAELSYRLWAAPLVAAVASLVPTLPEFLDPDAGGGGLLIRSAVPGLWTPVAHHAGFLAGVWVIGASVPAALILAAERQFQRRARAGLVGPAVTGAWPHMVVPLDYRARFTEAERMLIREHEREHMARRHPAANLFIAVLQVVSWFNPLAHVAAACARLDQELACDAAVIARHPRRRRDYARTLLKAHAGPTGSPLACALAAGRRHPLEVRVAMLATPRISARRDVVGVFAVGALAVGLAVALWGWAPL
jgi:beta-lactamase regulating signal transducer with metallopeptidase domain